MNHSEYLQMTDEQVAEHEAQICAAAETYVWAAAHLDHALYLELQINELPTPEAPTLAEWVRYQREVLELQTKFQAAYAHRCSMYGPYRDAGKELLRLTPYKEGLLVTVFGEPALVRCQQRDGSPVIQIERRDIPELEPPPTIDVNEQEL